ncbi:MULTISPECIES: DUF5681 domain-containing protein [unclassified Advenella]|uniref:DUF5681 domain-containing protein n=1 Tax=unclassified Advenella TaxID=2685285 RepID=UPI0018D568CB|nr:MULTISPECIES: DUF5681 domain-containing protein [unclassified Advenella]
MTSTKPKPPNNDLVQPEWLKNFKPVPVTGNEQWQKGMRSPNPKGRPKGVIDKRARLAYRMMENAGGIVDKMVEQALEGDAQAAALILTRVMPALRAQTERVEFNLNVAAPIAKQVEQVLDAISRGLIASDVAKQIIDAIGTLGQIRSTEELEARIAALENKE